MSDPIEMAISLEHSRQEADWNAWDAENALLRRYLAAALDACDYAHSEGFEWPTDPFGEVALAFADPTTVLDRIAPIEADWPRRETGSVAQATKAGSSSKNSPPSISSQGS